jgi:hypothetical protein
MQQAQRAEHNHALEYAAQKANTLGQPLLVAQGQAHHLPSWPSQIARAEENEWRGAHGAQLFLQYEADGLLDPDDARFTSQYRATMSFRFSYDYWVVDLLIGQ